MRIAWAAIAAVLAAAAFVIVMVSRPGYDDERYGAAVGIGLCVALVAVMLLLVWRFTSSLVATRFERLARGEGVLGRWLVDPVTWRQALRARRELDRQPDVLKTALDLPDESPPGGMEIVVCEDAVYVGDRIWHPLFVEHGLPVVLSSGWLEFQQFGDETPTHVVRVPVPAGAEAAADAVLRRFARSMEPYRSPAA